MKTIICLTLAVFAIVHSTNGGEADSKTSDAAKLLVSKQVKWFKIMYYYYEIQLKTVDQLRNFINLHFQIQNRYLVEGMDVVIRYGLYNVGDSVASDIVLTEAGFGSDDFDIAGTNHYSEVIGLQPSGI